MFDKKIDLKRRKKIKVRQTLHSETEKTIKSLLITLTSMIVVLIIAFFVVTNENAQRGYTLEQEKLKNEHLKENNENLTTKITRSTSFKEIRESEVLSEMTENDEKTYVTTDDNKVN